MPRIEGGPPLREFFLVAMADPETAMQVLRARRDMDSNVELTNIGEATADLVKWLGVEDGEIFGVLAIS
jgi:hypothetical protein